MPYLLGLFHWGACRMSKLRAMSKMKSCKIYRIEWEMHAMSRFGLSFCECMESMHAYPLPIHCAEILRYFWRISHANNHKRKAQNLTSHAFPIQSDQFCNLSFLTLPPIYSHCTRPGETILTHKASIERQINRLSRDI